MCLLEYPNRNKSKPSILVVRICHKQLLSIHPTLYLCEYDFLTLNSKCFSIAYRPNFRCNLFLLAYICPILILLVEDGVVLVLTIGQTLDAEE